MNITDEQREKLARFEAHRRGKRAMYLSGKVTYPNGSFNYDDSHWLVGNKPATPPDTADGALWWMGALGMFVKQMSDDSWVANREVDPVHPGFGETPIEAIARCAIRCAEAWEAAK